MEKYGIQVDLWVRWRQLSVFPSKGTKEGEERVKSTHKTSSVAMYVLNGDIS